MPEPNLIDLRQHVMQAVAGFMEQRDYFVVRKQGRLAYAIDRCRFGEIADQIGNRCLYAVAGQTPGTGIIHPGAAALAAARVQVEIELTHQLAVAFDAEKLDVGMPYRRAVGADVDAEQALDQLEQAVDHLVFGKYCLTSCSENA